MSYELEGHPVAGMSRCMRNTRNSHGKRFAYLEWNGMGFNVKRVTKTHSKGVEFATFGPSHPECDSNEKFVLCCTCTRRNYALVNCTFVQVFHILFRKSDNYVHGYAVAAAAAAMAEENGCRCSFAR